jgi:hypothetical protein
MLLQIRQNILWIDCLGAFSVGSLFVLLAPWLAPLLQLPTGFVRTLGALNLLYGAYSLSLARRPTRPVVLIKFLVFANITWTFICLLNVYRLAGQASPLALAHFTLEGLWVAFLAKIEWEERDRLATFTLPANSE